MSSTTRTSRHQYAHCHVAAFMALPWTRLHDGNDNDESSSSSSSSPPMIQVIHDGSLLTVENLCANTTTNTTYNSTATTACDDDEQNSKQQQQKTTQQKDAEKLSLHRPMLILDTPESIGMTLPAASSKRKKRARNDNDDDAVTNNNDDKNENSNKFSIRHVADLLGEKFPVRVIDVKNQQELPDWTLGDLVDYFHDEERLLRNATHNNNINNNNSNDDAGDAIAKNNHAAVAGDEASMEAPPRRQRPVRRAAQKSVVNQQQQQQKGDEMPLVLNQISLEFSNTALGKKVRSPQFVRDLDWIDQAWRFPQSSSSSSSKNGHAKKKNKTKTSKNNNSNNNNRSRYPAVQYYCLSSAAGCYTDFHVDFGGSSVWYNVVSGAKHFCLIPPTRQNLKLYEEWLCSTTQAQDFFAQIVLENHQHEQDDDDKNSSSSSSDKSVIYKIALKERQTLIIPAGWIHCVYTPTDSLVFGGNFLHGFDIDLQLNVYSIEVRSRVLEQYRFPMFIQVHFAAASMYLHLLKQQQQQQQQKSSSSSCRRRPSLLEIQSLGRLIEAVTMWWNPTAAATTMTTTTTTDDDDDESISIPVIAQQVAAEHDCATFQDFLTLLQLEHERALVDVQQQNRATIATISAVAVADNDDDKVQKEVNGMSPATSPRLRVKLTPSSRGSSNSKVDFNATEKSKDESSKLSSTVVGGVDNDCDEKFRIEVSVASRQGRSAAPPRRCREKVESNDNDEWLPSSAKKQQRRREKEPSPSVATGSNKGQMSPTPTRAAVSLKQQPVKKQTKKTETKATTCRQRLLKKVGR